jgi:hypothetical protein
MRKGNAPFVFNACFVLLGALLGCSGEDANVGVSGGVGGDSVASGAGGTASPDGGMDELDSGRAGRGGPGFGDGSGGSRFSFDAFTFDIQIPRDPNCPGSMPMDNDPCTQAASCAYPSGGCTCQRDGRGDAGRTWHCQEFPQRDGGYRMCDEGTVTGSGCDTQGKFCTNGSQTCGCFGTNPMDRKWTCF